ncbi:HIPL1 protein, partial [Dichanthelium oligosanthes]
LGEGLSFCGYYSGMISCCNADDDAALRERFMDMNVSDPDCAAIAKAILCEACSPSPLLADPATTRSLPLMCAAAAAATSLSSPAHRDPSGIQEEGTMCLERLATGSYLGLVPLPHPDASGRAFLYTQDGKVWLASIPARGTGAALRVGDSPFLHLTHLVGRDAALGLGLMGVALHPRFTSSGRLFFSYTAGRCSAAQKNGSRPCQYELVVAELSASRGGDDHTKVAHADASEVRRIFTMRVPQPRTSSYSKSEQRHGGGQILIGPADGYLYLVTGHGEATDEMPFLGKIIRFDIDGQSPKPEIVAVGLSNPRGCSFDSDRPSDLYCANVDQQQGEQVLLISNMGANHSSSSARARVSLVVDHGLPAAGTAPSILGGVVYRGSANPWLNGRYIYMYSSDAWDAVETPARGGGRYAAARIPNVRCSAGGTPMPCAGGGSSVLSLLGEDNSKDAFVLATGGVFRVAAPGLCGAPPPASPPPQSKQAGLVWQLLLGAFSLVFAFFLVWSMMFGGGGGAQCCGNIFCCIWNCGRANNNNN